MPKVSIIVPVHNVSKYLSTCLNSLVNQTEKSIEIICVNDHSVDESYEILKYYEEMYSDKIKVLDMKEKYGVSCARNLGLSVAQGEYIGFVDSDDVVSLNMYEDFLNAAKSYSVPMVIGDFFRIDAKEYLQKETFVREQKRPFCVSMNPTIFFQQNVTVWDKLFSHDFILDETFLENYNYEDVNYIYPLLFRASNIVELKRKDYAYRRNTFGIMDKSMIPNIKVLDMLPVCLDAIQKGVKNQFSVEQMRCLSDALKRSLLYSICWITNWPICDKEKTFLIRKLLAIYDFYFRDIKHFETLEGSDKGSVATGALAYYDYDSLGSEKEAIQMLKRVKRKINSLEKSSICKFKSV